MREARARLSRRVPPQLGTGAVTSSAFTADGVDTVVMSSVPEPAPVV
jgi:hypothetical protein